MLFRSTPTPLTPQEGWGDEQITYGPYAPTSPGYSGASEDNMDEQQKTAKRAMEHAGLSWTACYDDGCFVHLSEKQGRWYPKKPSQHKFERNTPYETQPSPPPQPPKPKHGNTREMHAQRVNWDKCYNRRCKTHRQQKEEAGYYPKRGEKAARTPLEEEGGRKLHVRWSDETLVDDNSLQRQLTELLKERDTLKETILLQDSTIQSQQKTIEQQRVAIEAGSTTIAMLQRQWKGEERINKNLWRECKRAGRLLIELGN